jgi:hypothetical protein
VYTGHVRCSKEERPPELISLGNSLRPLRYNSPDCPVYTGLSCVTAGQRLFRRQQLPATHLMRALRAQTSGVPILTHRTMNRICPVCTGLSGAPSNRQPPPTVKFGGWGYKYPNHPTIHCIQVFQLPTTIQELAFIAKHNKRDQILSQLHTKP